MQQTPAIQIEMWQLVAILVTIGFISGILLGLIPFFLGKRKNNPKLGKIGLVSCIIAGFILGPVIALITAIVFAIVILSRKQDLPAADVNVKI